MWKIEMIWQKKRATTKLNQIVSAADTQYSRKEWLAAALNYRAALKIDPNLSHAWTQLGDCEVKTGKFPDARIAYEAALKVDPDSVDALKKLGYFLKSTGDLVAAFQNIKAAFDRNGDLTLEGELKAIVGTRRSLSEFLSHTHSVFDSDYYIQANPDVAEAGVVPIVHFIVYGWKELRPPSAKNGVEFAVSEFLHTAEIQYLYKEWGAAAESYRSALALDPNSSRIWAQLGTCEYEAGNNGDAKHAYEMAVQNDPNNRDALVQLGHLLKDVGDRIGAFQRLKAAFDLTLDPGIESELRALIGTSKSLDEFLFSIDSIFDPEYYVKANADVAEAGIDPRLHFMIYGWKERRFPSNGPGTRSFDPFFTTVKDSELYANQVRLSVVMPTYNRAGVLETTLQRLLSIIGGDPIEIVVIDDGSGDRTPDVLARLAETTDKLIFRSIKNGGPGRARNLGASLARGEIILFLGDDTQPVNSDLFRAHYQAHQINKSAGHTVLGKVIWPNDKLNMPNTVMSLIQGDGQQQFGYKGMKPWQKYAPWLFYTANVSVKRNIVQEWDKDGFDASFTLAAFEDAEFAYRMSQRYQDFGVYYTPNAIVEHYHPYNVEGFMRRQVNCGLMIDVILKKHPELSRVILGEALHEILVGNIPSSNGRELPTHHYSTMIEGIRAWALVIDNHQGLGSQNWHTEFLSAVFRLTLLDAYLMMRRDKSTVQAMAYKYLIEDFRLQMGRALSTEVFGDYQLMNLV